MFSSFVLINDIITGHDIVNRAWVDQQEVDNDIQSMECNTVVEKNNEVNKQQALNPITESTMCSNTLNPVNSNTDSSDLYTFICTTDSTPQSIPPSTISVQSTEVKCCVLCVLLLSSYINIFTSICSLRIIMAEKNINQV